MGFWLEYEANGAQQQYQFDSASVSIGRDQASDFRLDHPTVSRQHALIVRGQRGFQLVVLSRGGLTAVDGNKVSGEVDLHDGAVLHIGQINFRFRSNEAPAQPAFGGAGAGGGWQAAMQQPANGFGGGQPAAGANGGGFGSPAFKPPVAADPPRKPNKDDDGIVSWDEIANSAEALDEEAVDSKHATDFEKIQAASKKAEEAQKTNPALLVGVVLAAAFMGYTFLIDDGGGPGGGGEVEVEDTRPFVPKIDCVGKSECMKEARNKYKYGVANLEKRDVHIANTWSAYESLVESKLYLEKAGVDKAPPEFKNLEDKTKEARDLLDDRFQKLKVKYAQAQSRSQYHLMVESIDATRNYFPNRTSQEFRWADKMERKMKDNGQYPR